MAWRARTPGSPGMRARKEPGTASPVISASAPIPVLMLSPAATGMPWQTAHTAPGPGCESARMGIVDDFADADDVRVADDFFQHPKFVTVPRRTAIGVEDCESVEYSTLEQSVAGVSPGRETHDARANSSASAATTCDLTCEQKLRSSSPYSLCCGIEYEDDKSESRQFFTTTPGAVVRGVTGELGKEWTEHSESWSESPGTSVVLMSDFDSSPVSPRTTPPPPPPRNSNFMHFFAHTEDAEVQRTSTESAISSEDELEMSRGGNAEEVNLFGDAASKPLHHHPLQALSCEHQAPPSAATSSNRIQLRNRQSQGAADHCIQYFSPAPDVKIADYEEILSRVQSENAQLRQENARKKVKMQTLTTERDALQRCADIHVHSLEILQTENDRLRQEFIKSQQALSRSFEAREQERAFARKSDTDLKSVATAVTELSEKQAKDFREQVQQAQEVFRERSGQLQDEMQRIREAWKQSEKEAAQWRAQAQSEKNDQSTDCDGLNDSDAETQLRARAEAAERDLALLEEQVDVKLQDARRELLEKLALVEAALSDRAAQVHALQDALLKASEESCQRTYFPASPSVQRFRQSAEEELQVMSTELAHARDELSKLNESKLEAERKTGTKELEIARLREELHTRRFTLSRLESGCEEKREYCRRLEKEVAGKTKDVEARDNRIKSLAGECDRLQTECDCLRSQVRDNNYQMQVLREQNNDLTQDKVLLGDERDRLSGHANNLTLHLRNVQHEKDVLQRELQQAQRVARESQADADDVHDALVEAQQREATLQKDVQSLYRQLQDLRLAIEYAPDVGGLACGKGRAHLARAPCVHVHDITHSSVDAAFKTQQEGTKPPPPPQREIDAPYDFVDATVAIGHANNVQAAAMCPDELSHQRQDRHNVRSNTDANAAQIHLPSPHPSPASPERETVEDGDGIQAYVLKKVQEQKMLLCARRLAQKDDCVISSLFTCSEHKIPDASEQMFQTQISHGENMPQDENRSSCNSNSVTTDDAAELKQEDHGQTLKTETSPQQTQETPQENRRRKQVAMVKLLQQTARLCLPQDTSSTQPSCSAILEYATRSQSMEESEEPCAYAAIQPRWASLMPSGCIEGSISAPSSTMPDASVDQKMHEIHNSMLEKTDLTNNSILTDAEVANAECESGSVDDDKLSWVDQNLLFANDATKSPETLRFLERKEHSHTGARVVQRSQEASVMHGTHSDNRHERAFLGGIATQRKHADSLVASVNIQHEACSGLKNGTATPVPKDVKIDFGLRRLETELRHTTKENTRPSWLVEGEGTHNPTPFKVTSSKQHARGLLRNDSELGKRETTKKSSWFAKKRSGGRGQGDGLKGWDREDDPQSQPVRRASWRDNVRSLVGLRT